MQDCGGAGTLKGDFLGKFDDEEERVVLGNGWQLRFWEAKGALPCAFLWVSDTVSRLGPGLYRREVILSFLCPSHLAPSACENPPGTSTLSLSTPSFPFSSPQTGLKTFWPGSGLQRSGLAWKAVRS